MARRMFRALLAAALLALPAPVLAWGEYGHRTTAAIAWALMSPEAKAAARRLLRQSAQLATPECPIRTLEDASYWPDCIRGYSERFSYTFPWHYQNMNVCQAFDPKKNCPNGACAPQQIERNLKLLADDKLPAGERLFALAFVAHLVGDMHQPMHSGDHDDRGGNDVKVAYGYIAGERTNLHGIWDTEMAERLISEPPAGVTGLLSQIGAEQRAAWRQGGIADWHREAFEAARDGAYANLPGVRICEADPQGRVQLWEPYVAASRATLRTQASRAGVRLAKLLDEALG